MFSEADKNESATPVTDPYGYSKVQCEKEIESFVASLPSNERFTYVMINPSAIYGPLLTATHIAGSPQVWYDAISLVLSCFCIYFNLAAQQYNTIYIK